MKKLESPLPMFGWIGPVVPEKKIFKFRQCIFAIPLLNPLGKRVWSLIWTKLSPYHPRMLCDKFVEICLMDLRKKYLTFVKSMDFRYFFIIFPWKRARSFIWTNLNPLKSHRNALCHVWLKLAPWLCRRFSNRCTFAISLLAPLGKRQGPSFKELESPSHSNVLYQVLLKFASMVLETKAKIWNVYNNDDAGQQTNFAHLSLRLMWP